MLLKYGLAPSCVVYNRGKLIYSHNGTFLDSSTVRFFLMNRCGS